MCGNKKEKQKFISNEILKIRKKTKSNSNERLNIHKKWKKTREKGRTFMKIKRLAIKNFKSIRDMELPSIENALILVGKNNTGKSAILHALQAVEGSYTITEEDFNETMQNIEIAVTLSITEEDLKILHQNGVVSQYKKYELWKEDFCRHFPSYKIKNSEQNFDDQAQNQNSNKEKNLKNNNNNQDYRLDKIEISFTFIANREGKQRFSDGINKHNKYIREIFPTIYFIGTERNVKQIQEDLFLLQEDNLLKLMRTNCCMFDPARRCHHCFQCIGLIKQKTPEQLNAFEAAKLFEYKLYQVNIDQFEKRINESFHKNGGYEDIIFSMNYDVNQMLQVNAEAYNKGRDSAISVEHLGCGMKSIYMLSLLEAYVADENRLPSIIMVEEPEMFLHPQLQKTCSEILYRLSQKNQVIFTTHSPHLLSNFSSRQLCQIVLDENAYSVAKKKTNISAVLDDLGYSAADLMNVDFVFIVEGKQDKYRLPLLLNHYYSEIYDENGKLNRVSILTTNSCTNIKTYANLKYMNQTYMKDRFLMIRDSDGKDREELGRSLCKYYDERNVSDVDHLPKVTRRNVLILKYYSFENYFLNPSIMSKLGIVKSEEEFYQILYEKWREYLHRIKSGQHLIQVLGRDFASAEDMKEHLEEIKIYMRGHNLFDIFYGRYKKEEKKILKKYIQIAPREEFQDILDAADAFIYFKSRQK